MKPPENNVRCKVCGITNLTDARYCAGAGVDFLGFIQYEKSPRYVEPSMAHDIIEWLYGPETVGVFVDAPIEIVNERVDEVGFSMIQLHGHETPWECSQIKVPVIKALRVRPGDDPDQLRARMTEYVPYVNYFLLDTYHETAYGGTGQSFDWTIAQTLAKDFPIFIAGGLNPENVTRAMKITQPFAVDVSSGVEESPGQKDLDKLTAFIELVQAYTP